HRGVQVDQLYRKYLGRAADPAGRTTFVNWMLGGATEADVARSLLASGEYQASHPDSVSFMNGVFADVLGRGGDPAEVLGWAQAIDRGLSRDAVARAFLTNPEYYLLQIDCAYRTYLVRRPDGPGRQNWLTALQNGQATTETLTQSVLASDEL